MLLAMKLIIFCLTRYVMPLIAVVSDSLASQCLGWHWGGTVFCFHGCKTCVCCLMQRFHIQLFVIMLKGLKVARSTHLMLEALMP